jgi:molybdopterin-guanine dinucleotide biosynthesis protein A
LDDRLLIAVLAGGEGRRMGGGKALRPFRGAPLAAHAVALARRWSSQVVVVVRDESQAGALDAPLIRDLAGIAGPLAGLAAALAHAETLGAAHVLTLACDMPHLPANLPARLAAALGPEVGVALPAAGGDLQPACGLWRTRARAELPAYLASGQTSLRGFAAACGLAVVDFGPEAADAFANINTPEDLARLEARAAAASATKGHERT